MSKTYKSLDAVGGTECRVTTEEIKPTPPGVREHEELLRASQPPTRDLATVAHVEALRGEVAQLREEILSIIHWKERAKIAVDGLVGIMREYESRLAVLEARREEESEGEIKAIMDRASSIEQEAVDTPGRRKR